MSQTKASKEKEEYLAAAAAMYDQLRQWREQHPEASIDEIAGQVTPRRRELMGELLKQLVRQHGAGEVVEGLACPACGGGMIYKGAQKRGIVHLEGEVGLARAYYYCAQCETGLFPPG